MTKRKNELFIGKEYLSVEGREIKHPALIEHYATPTTRKIGKEPINLMGLDIETDYENGDMKLLGTYQPEKGYQHFTPEKQEKFAPILFSMVRYCKSENMDMAYWNRLDPFQFFKVMVLNMKDKDAQQTAIGRFGKEGGEFNKKKGWIVPPLVRFQIDGYEFGIKQVIRSAIQFYFRSPESREINTVWAYDIATFYYNGLDYEASSRFDWYSKVSETAHKIDWFDFHTDRHYRENVVLKSNRLDAMAAYYLGMEIQKNFKKAFKHYPTTLVSAGGLARSSIVANTSNRLAPHYPDRKEFENALRDEVSSIGIMHHYDNWVDTYGGDFVKDMMSMFVEAYSGGQIEAYRYGKTEYAWYADIASAYPGIIQNLKDLRDAKIDRGNGTPPYAKDGYVFVRGTVTIPADVNIHPLTVKHPVFTSTNIRPNGTYRASYLIEERDFLEEVGAEFKDESWYRIETTGKKSVIAKANKESVDIRKQLKAKGDSAEKTAKDTANSGYGILFEAVPVFHVVNRVKTETVVHRETFYKDMLKPYLKKLDLNPLAHELKHLLGQEQYAKIRNRWHTNDNGMGPDVVREELESSGVFIKYDNPVDILIELENLYMYEPKMKEEFQYNKNAIERKGYRGGEFLNPLYAAVITGLTRLMMSRAGHEIEKKGGRVIIMMTDSITWQGKKDMMPDDLVKYPKTLGYFEPAEPVKDMVCLGSGRYGFYKKDAKGEFRKYEAKKRGLNASDIQNPNGVSLGAFDWQTMLDQMVRDNSDTVNVSVRTLISPGLVYASTDRFTVKDLGFIVQQTRNVKAVVGMTKRDINPQITNPKALNAGLVDTKPIVLKSYMFGSNTLIDQTLPQLREEMMKKKCQTKKQKDAKTNRKSCQNYWKNNEEKLKEQRRSNYRLAKIAGYSPAEAQKMKSWSTEKLFYHIKTK